MIFGGPGAAVSSAPRLIRLWVGGGVSVRTEVSISSSVERVWPVRVLQRENVGRLYVGIDSIVWGWFGVGYDEVIYGMWFPSNVSDVM